MFLGGNRAVASIGEINYISKAISIDQACSCGVSICKCSEWARVFDVYAKRYGFDPRVDPYRLGLWDARAVNLVDRAHQTHYRVTRMRLRSAWLYAREWLPQSLYHLAPIPPKLSRAVDGKFKLAETIAAAWGKSHVIDSSKNAREAVELWKRRPDAIRILLLTRDGRGVYHSRRKAGRSREESIQGWRDYYLRFIPLIERHVAANAVLRVKYEELAVIPHEVGADLCRFLGLEFNPEMLDFAKIERHLVAGNDTRFSSSKGISLDERWRIELKGEELDYFNRHAGFLNEILGYR